MRDNYSYNPAVDAYKTAFVQLIIRYQAGEHMNIYSLDPIPRVNWRSKVKTWASQDFVDLGHTVIPWSKVAVIEVNDVNSE